MRNKCLVFASILAGLLVMCLPVRAQPAADTCLTAPDQKAPEGSQWHYRTERSGTSTRKCYFLRAEADKLRAVQTKPERPRSMVTVPAADTGSPIGRQPIAPSRAAAPVRERTED